MDELDQIPSLTKSRPTLPTCKKESVCHGICDRVVVVLVGAPNGHSHGFVEGAPFRCAAKMTEASKVRFSKFPFRGFLFRAWRIS